jgi:hypothetical protein
VRFSLGRRHEQVIYLDEDVYVVIGDGVRAATERSAWPATGVYGPIPRDGVIGMPDDVLGELGPELWRAKRRGREACMVEALQSYDVATVLLWGADCVEHLAHRVNGVDGNVVETLALARSYALEREFQSGSAQRLAAEAQNALERLRKGGIVSFGKGVISRVGDSEIPFGGLLGPSETRYEAGQFATADLRAMQVALMHATKALCGADPLTAGREAASWSRRASARNELARVGASRAIDANASSWLNLFLNPLASGTLVRSLPGQVKAIKNGDVPEAEWQAARLEEYLQRTDHQPLPFRRW